MRQAAADLRRAARGRARAVPRRPGGGAEAGHHGEGAAKGLRKGGGL